MKIANCMQLDVFPKESLCPKKRIGVNVEFIKVRMKGTEIDFAERRIQFSGTTKKKLLEVANENTLYRATARIKADTVDVSERLSTNSKKIE